MIELSICIPTFNRSANLAETLQRCVSEIESGGLQSSVEILVGDNASTDGTGNVCLILKKEHRFFNYIKNQENIGSERNWSNLVNFAQGRYVWILCDDDDFLPGLIVDILKITKNTNYSVIYLNYNFFNDDDKNMTYGKASDDSVDYVGMGWQTFFEKTNFSSSFTSSNIFSRNQFIKNLTFIDQYKGNPWLQLYVAKILLDERSYYFYSPLKLKMRALTIEVSRREKHIGGSPHFYFNAHVAFIEFLLFINWGSSKFRRRMISEQFIQIYNEKTSWRDITGSEDYRYWILIAKRIIQNGYFNTSIIFWVRNFVAMLLPSAFTVKVNNFLTIKHKVGKWLRSIESR